MITPAPRLVERDADPDSVCAYYRVSGIVSSLTCTDGLSCLTATSLHPPALYCPGQVAHKTCLDGTSLPTTTCAPDQLCCSTGQFCGQWVINDTQANAQAVIRQCATTSFSSPAFTSRPSATPSGSSTGDTIALIVFLVCGFVGAILFIIASWWFCCRRKSMFRQYRQRKRLAQVPQSVGRYSAYSGVGTDDMSIALLPNKPQGDVQVQQTSPVLAAVGSEGGVSSYRASQPGQLVEAEGKTLTYRVSNIPWEIDTKDKLKSLFFMDRPRIEVRSLVPAFSGYGDTRARTATIEFASLRGASSKGPRLADASSTVHVDRDFFGFTPLSDPREPIEADVIAVTGLAGHAFGSWACSPYHMWLRDYLPKDFTHVRVLTYGYNSQLQDNPSCAMFGSLSEDFTNRLKSHWESQYWSRPTILIGHSLGGLLIKKALVESEHFVGRPPLASLVPLTIFFGTPHGGLEINALETLVMGQPSQPLIQELRKGSYLLSGLQTQFARIAREMRILTVYETFMSKTAIKVNGKWKREGEEVMMVKPEHARLEMPNEICVTSATDHSRLAKLENSESGPYGSVREQINAALNIRS